MLVWLSACRNTYTRSSTGCLKKVNLYGTVSVDVTERRRKKKCAEHYIFLYAQPSLSSTHTTYPELSWPDHVWVPPLRCISGVGGKCVWKGNRGVLGLLLPCSEYGWAYRIVRHSLLPVSVCVWVSRRRVSLGRMVVVGFLNGKWDGFEYHNNNSSSV